MGNMLVAMLFLSFCVMSFQYSYAYMGAYRAFYGLFTREMDLFVVNLTTKGESMTPYFSLTKVKTFTEEYLAERLANVCDFKFEAKGFEFSDDNGRFPMGVSINLRCYLLKNKLMDKTAYFTLVENE